MADKRIHELTDEQANYSTDLMLACDDATFDAAKRVKMSTIYKKAFTLSAATGVNLSEYLLKLDNGAGSESKIVLNNFFGLLMSEMQATLYNASGVNVGTLYLRRFGKIVTGAFDVIVGSGSSSLSPVYATSAGSGGDLLELATEFRPVTSCVSFLEFSGNANAIQFNSDGTLSFTISAAQGLAIGYATT